MSQQAIMYGHAWHFWLQRELPAQERKIPRALMEVAGHFFALLLLKKSKKKQLQWKKSWKPFGRSSRLSRTMS